MNSLAKAILRRVFFRGKSLKTFPPFQIKEDNVREKVFISNGHFELDKTKDHCLVCHDPFLIAIYFRQEELDQFESQLTLTVRSNAVHAQINLVFREQFKLEHGQLRVFLAEDCSCHQMSSLDQYLLLRYFKNKDSIHQGKLYAGIYSYPRQVIIVSYRDNDYYNIFPMDFQCWIEDERLMVLGLRTTNYTIGRLLQTKKVVISYHSSVGIDDIYQLGRNHSQSPPALTELPIKTTTSKKYDFHIPAACGFYRELELVLNQKLGSHMLLLARVVNTVTLSESKESIYHLHYFQGQQANYQALS